MQGVEKGNHSVLHRSLQYNSHKALVTARGKKSEVKSWKLSCCCCFFLLCVRLLTFSKVSHATYTSAYKPQRKRKNGMRTLQTPLCLSLHLVPYCKVDCCLSRRRKSLSDLASRKRFSIPYLISHSSGLRRCTSPIHRIRTLRRSKATTAGELYVRKGSVLRYTELYISLFEHQCSRNTRTTRHPPSALHEKNAHVH